MDAGAVGTTEARAEKAEAEAKADAVAAVEKTVDAERTAAAAEEIGFL